MNQTLLAWLRAARLPLWLVVPIAYALWLFIGWSIKRVSFAWLRHLASRTETELDDILLGAADGPLTLLIATGGAAAIFHALVPSAPKAWSVFVNNASKVATIAAIGLFVDHLISRLLASYAERVEALKASQAFTSVLVHLAVVAIAGLVVLDSLGISITPIIASLGIGSLAVALALQPTLENLFSGFQIIIDQPVRPGQYVKLESGEEGYIERTGWRTTWIRQLSNNMVIIPNKQLVNSRLTNFYHPSRDVSVSVDVGVHYDSDLDRVERVVGEVAGDIMARVPGAVADFKPFIRYHTFADSSVNFSVVMRGKEFTDSFLIKHEFIKALAKRFAAERIVIPFPVTAINLSQEKASLSAPTGAS